MTTSDTLALLDPGLVFLAYDLERRLGTDRLPASFVPVTAPEMVGAYRWSLKASARPARKPGGARRDDDMAMTTPGTARRDDAMEITHAMAARIYRERLSSAALARG